MIASLTGKLTRKAVDYSILDVSGVGYQVFAQRLPQFPGEPGELRGQGVQPLLGYCSAALQQQGQVFFGLPYFRGILQRPLLRFPFRGRRGGCGVRGCYFHIFQRGNWPG